MSDAAPTSAAHDFAHYLAPIKRRRRIVIAFVLLGLILGAAAAALLHPTYTAAAAVSVGTDATDNAQPVNQAGGRTTGSVNMDTEAQIAGSKTVAQLAADELNNGTAPGVLQRKLTVTVPPNTTILRLAFTARSPDAATAGARAFADAYLKNRRDTSQAFLDSQIQNIQTQLDHANATLHTDLETKKSITNHNSPEYPVISQKVINDQQATNSLTGQLTGLQTTTLNPGQITTEPTASGLAPSPLREISVATGLVLGLLVGLLGAFARDRMDPTVRSRTDVELLGVPVNAEIPKPSRKRREIKSGKADREDAIVRRKANQRVATGIAAALGAEGGSIYIANLAPHKHADHVADDLARELGRFGSTVEIAGRGEDSIGRSWDPAGYAAGLVHSDHARFTDLDTSLHTRAAVAVVEQALGRSRFVIIDGLGDFEGLDPYVLSSLGQVSVVVVEQGATTREELADAVDQMSMTSCHILGALMWNPPTQANAPTENGSYRRFPPRAIESSATVEPPTEPTAGPSTPTPAGPTGGLLGWPEPAPTRSNGLDSDLDDTDIEDAEVVSDDHSDEGGWDQSAWNRAPQ